MPVYPEMVRTTYVQVGGDPRLTCDQAFFFPFFFLRADEARDIKG